MMVLAVALGAALILSVFGGMSVAMARQSDWGAVGLAWGITLGIGVVVTTGVMLILWGLLGLHP